MADIALQEYIEQLEDLVENNRVDEVVAHARHILQHYPKYLGVYRVVGKAMLEVGQDKYAGDMFKRVLSGDPEDYLTRVAISILYDRQGDLEKALWHMERAFELAPDNEAIRGEMRRLYGRRDGVEPGRLDLTRGALARTYIRGGLYSRAVEEVQTLLAGEPARVDLQVALAEALWRNEQRAAAEDVCRRILEELPFCLKANLIMGEVYSRTGRDEAREHLRRAQALDPGNEVAAELFGSESPVSPQEIRLPFLPFAPGAEQPAWIPEPDQPPGPVSPDEVVSLEEMTATMEAQIEIPPWLEEAAVDDAPPPAAAGGPEAPNGLIESEQPAMAPDSQEDVPDWLAGPPLDIAGDAPLSAEMGEPAPEEASDWMAGLASLQGIDEMSDEAGPDREGAQQPGAQELTGAVAGEDEPGWLASEGLAGEEIISHTVQDLEGALPGEVPDWLTEMAPDGVFDQPAAEGDAPDWLGALAPEEAGEQPAPEPSAPESDGEAPDWLGALAPEGVEDGPAVPEPAPAAAETVEGMPSWLVDMAPGEPIVAPPATEPELPAEPTAEAVGETPAAPAWLEADGVPDGEDALAFLESLAAGKEDELRAAAEAQAEARVAELVGQPSAAEPSAAPEPPPPPSPEPVAESLPSPDEAVTEPVWLHGDGMPDGEAALAFLESLAEGKEDQLRAAAEAEAEARLAELTGPPPPGPAEPAPEPTPPVEEAVTAPEWLVGEGVPEAEVRVAELTEPVAPPSEPSVAADETAEPAGAPEWLSEFTEPAVAPSVEEEAGAAEPVDAFGWTSFGADEGLAETGEEPPLPEISFDWGGLEAGDAPVAEEPVAERVAAPEVESPDEERPLGVPELVEELLAPEPPPAVEEVPAEPVAPSVAEISEPAAEPAQPPPPAETPPSLPEGLEELRKHVREHPRDREAQLELARGLWNEDRRSESLEFYSKVLKSNRLVEEVLADLESVTGAYSSDATFQRVLGDAYMRSGRLAEALELYRGALGDL